MFGQPVCGLMQLSGEGGNRLIALYGDTLPRLALRGQPGIAGQRVLHLRLQLRYRLLTLCSSVLPRLALRGQPGIASQRVLQLHLELRY